MQTEMSLSSCGEDTLKASELLRHEHVQILSSLLQTVSMDALNDHGPLISGLVLILAVDDTARSDLIEHVGLTVVLGAIDGNQELVDVELVHNHKAVASSGQSAITLFPVDVLVISEVVEHEGAESILAVLGHADQLADGCRASDALDATKNIASISSTGRNEGEDAILLVLLVRKDLEDDGRNDRKAQTIRLILDSQSTAIIIAERACQNLIDIINEIPSASDFQISARIEGLGIDFDAIRISGLGIGACFHGNISSCLEFLAVYFGQNYDERESLFPLITFIIYG